PPTITTACPVIATLWPTSRRRGRRGRCRTERRPNRPLAGAGPPREAESPWSARGRRRGALWTASERTSFRGGEPARRTLHTSESTPGPSPLANRSQAARRDDVPFLDTLQ